MILDLEQKAEGPPERQEEERNQMLQL